MWSRWLYVSPNSKILFSSSKYLVRLIPVRVSPIVSHFNNTLLRITCFYFDSKHGSISLETDLIPSVGKRFSAHQKFFYKNISFGQKFYRAGATNIVGHSMKIRFSSFQANTWYLTYLFWCELLNMFDKGYFWPRVNNIWIEFKMCTRAMHSNYLLFWNSKT